MKNISAEVITIGDEILFGQITDTNTQFISEKLSQIGIKTIRKSSVGDSKDEILKIFAEATTRAQIIIITGGLGPTKDDITKHTICEFFNDNLVMHEPTLAHVTSFFEKRGRPMLEINKQQALVPSKAKVLFNDWGTAPGMWIENNEKIFVSLPGVPYEMKLILENRVIPEIKSYFQTPFIFHKMIHTSGLGESYLAELIKDWEDNLPQHMKLAYLPSLGIVKLRITATGENQKLLAQETEKQVIDLQKLIPNYIFGYDADAKLEEVVGKLLLSKYKTISTAESCTGGYISHLLTSISGSSAYYKGSVISYSNEIKISELDINEDIINLKGAVSEEVVKQMAENVRKKLNTDYAISTSGITGPNGGTDEKPVGTVWVAIANREKVISKKFVFGNIRENNIRLSAVNALKMLFDLLVSEYDYKIL